MRLFYDGDLEALRKLAEHVPGSASARYGVNEDGTVTQRRPAGMALVVMAHGLGCVTAWQGDEHVRNYIQDAGGGDGRECSFPLSSIGGKRHRPHTDGVFVVELAWERVGLSDLPEGGPEYDLRPSNWTPVTKETWQAHLDGEWPWEPYPEIPDPIDEQYPPMTAAELDDESNRAYSVIFGKKA